MPDPLTRALLELRNLYSPGMQPEALRSWQVVRRAVLDGRAQLSTGLGVVQAASALRGTWEAYDAALALDEDEAVTRIDRASKAAEEGLITALDRLGLDSAAREERSRDVTQLTRKR